MDRRIMDKSKCDIKVLAKARALGYKAGLVGKPNSTDPYAGRIPHFSEQWQAGWNEAQKDLKR